MRANSSNRCYQICNFKVYLSNMQQNDDDLPAWSASNSGLSGVGVDKSGNWFSIEGKTKASAYCQEGELPFWVRDSFRKFVTKGKSETLRTTGTGTLVSEMLGSRLSEKSLVLKVSASGGVMIYPRKKAKIPSSS